MDGAAAYIQPELFVVAIVVYIAGMSLKKSALIKDKYIPLILGGLSITFCLLYFLSVRHVTSIESFFGIIFSASVQGILIAGCATYSNQILKQLNKKEE